MCNLTFDVFVDFINIFFVLFWGITITYLGLWSFGQLHIECCYLKQITYTYVHHNMQLWYKSIPLVLWNYKKKKKLFHALHHSFVSAGLKYVLTCTKWVFWRKKETGVEDKLFDLVWRSNVPELSCVFFPVQTITFEIKTFIYTAH